MGKQKFIDKHSGLIIGGGALAITSALMTQPVNAQTTAASSIDDVGNAIDSIAGIAGAAATVVILAMGVRLAIKQVNRVMTKG